jgi:hypothetical protein
LGVTQSAIRQQIASLEERADAVEERRREPRIGWFEQWITEQFETPSAATKITKLRTPSPSSLTRSAALVKPTLVFSS